MSNKG